MTKKGREFRQDFRNFKSENRLIVQRFRKMCTQDDRRDNGRLYEGNGYLPWSPNLIHKGGKP